MALSLPAIDAANNLPVNLSSLPVPSYLLLSSCTRLLKLTLPRTLALTSDLTTENTELHLKQVNPTGVGAADVCLLMVLAELQTERNIKITVHLCAPPLDITVLDTFYFLKTANHSGCNLDF